jgi:hypothetical protein
MIGDAIANATGQRLMDADALEESQQAENEPVCAAQKGIHLLPIRSPRVDAGGCRMKRAVVLADLEELEQV